MPTSPEVTDVAIVGAGPVGLFAVFQCGMLKMRCHVIDSLDHIGGTCTALYPEKPIYDIPAYPEIMAQGLIDKLEQQAAPFAPRYHLGQQVRQLETSGSRWRLQTSSGAIVNAAAVIIAAGAGVYVPNRPPLAGIDGYEGTSVHYAIRSRDALCGKRMVIAGGGDSAVDWALALAGTARKIYVVHRRAKFRAAPESLARLEKLAAEDDIVEVVTPVQLHGLEGDGQALSAVIVKGADGTLRKLEADCLLAFFGLTMKLGPIADWGLDLDRNLIKVNPATCATNLPGVHAIGDINCYPGKLKLILTGFSEAAMAAHAIYERVHPNDALHWEYSTTKGIPKLA